MFVDLTSHLFSVAYISVASSFIVFLLGAVFLLLISSRASTLPLINGRKPSEITYTHAKKRFLKDAQSLIKAGFGKASVFRIISENGLKTVLGSQYAREIRGHHALSFGAIFEKEFHANIRGFEPFRQGTTSDEIFMDAVRMQLTRSLGSVTQPLSSETAVALEKEWSDSTDWYDLCLKSSILRIVSQISSRVFLGDKLCRDPNWLRITVAYTTDSFIAAQELRLWPELIRPLAAYFLPSCRKIRRTIQEARAIIGPVLEVRRIDREAAIKSVKTPDRYVDAMQWMEDSAKGRYYDPAIAQLTFSNAAIHTTTDMLTQVLLDLCGQEEVIQALRTEISTVIQEEGWRKTALYKLKLMDSVLKESQRLKPINIVSMRRLALEDIELSNGIVIPRGTYVVVSSDQMWDPSVYPNPEHFDPYRFLRLREIPGHETSSLSVSPSPEHMGFGFGKHACPGRFFAINEVKIALCHILMKYDFKLAEGCIPKVRRHGFALSSDPLARISIKRRREEIVL
ncbi:cytochrome P450 [Talaromyces proteolyticus]|uniref:Cytochrome P450 n=1 Tax=Talaromyces proteolyticus TaxID=1131652 RepID=A0AAD4KLW6_9EURO|nr:cytochrome P450 [Talaromyces proteolyticus]KAH8691170.1 cytochrome P450 [Talaromyces proteolyticus]